jgi:hypothetical protein
MLPQRASQKPAQPTDVAKVVQRSATAEPRLDRDRLPLRWSILLIACASAVCYGLGYIVFASVRQMMLSAN